MGKWLKNGLKRAYKAILQRLAENCRSALVRAEAHPNSGSRCICSSRRKVSARESRRSLLWAMNGNPNSPSASQQMSWHHLHMRCTCEGDRGRVMAVAARPPHPAAAPGARRAGCQPAAPGPLLLGRHCPPAAAAGISAPLPQGQAASAALPAFGFSQTIC